MDACFSTDEASAWSRPRAPLVVGAAAIRGFFGEWARAYAEVSFDTADICELGSGGSFSVVNQRARLRGGGGELTLRYGLVTTWTDGLIQRQTTYSDIDEARAAAERLAQERADG